MRGTGVDRDRIERRPTDHDGRTAFASELQRVFRAEPCRILPPDRRKTATGELASLSSAQIGFPGLDPASRAKLRYGFLWRAWSADGRAHPNPDSVPLVSRRPQFRCWNAAFSICADWGERSQNAGSGTYHNLAPSHKTCNSSRVPLLSAIETGLQSRWVVNAG